MGGKSYHLKGIVSKYLTRAKNIVSNTMSCLYDQKKSVVCVKYNLKTPMSQEWDETWICLGGLGQPNIRAALAVGDTRMEG